MSLSGELGRPSELTVRESPALTGDSGLCLALLPAPRRQSPAADLLTWHYVRR